MQSDLEVERLRAMLTSHGLDGSAPRELVMLCIHSLCGKQRSHSTLKDDLRESGLLRELCACIESLLASLKLRTDSAVSEKFMQCMGDIERVVFFNPANQLFLHESAFASLVADALKFSLKMGDTDMTVQILRTAVNLLNESVQCADDFGSAGVK